MNAQMPYTFGDAVLPLDLVDHAIEVDEPLASHAPLFLDDAARLIGGRIADRVPHGADAADRHRRGPGRHPERADRAPRAADLDARCSATACSPSTGPAPSTRAPR